MLFSRKWGEEQKTAVYLSSVIPGQLPEPAASRRKAHCNNMPYPLGCVVLLGHDVNLQHEFNKWMNFINVKPMMCLLAKTKTQTLQNNRALKRESARQCLPGAAPQAPRGRAGLAGLFLVGTQLLRITGPAGVSALELGMVAASPDWQQLSDVCDRHCMFLMAG